jgi:two-component system response regulator AtoC
MDESWLPRDLAPAAVQLVPEVASDDSVNLRKHVEVLERTLIGRTMAAVGGNQSEAARRLGMSRGSLIERLKRYGPLAG